jgi:hypothetical protein
MCVCAFIYGGLTAAGLLVVVVVGGDGVNVVGW